MELSAVFSLMAATLLANVSGILVPKATNVIATTVFSNPTKHPNMLARSDIKAVIKPIKMSDPIKVRYPPAMDGGGMKANKTWKSKNINLFFKFVSIHDYGFEAVKAWSLDFTKTKQF